LLGQLGIEAICLFTWGDWFDFVTLNLPPTDVGSPYSWIKDLSEWLSALAMLSQRLTPGLGAAAEKLRMHDPVFPKITSC
jgi:hypothetical protein